MAYRKRAYETRSVPMCPIVLFLNYRQNTNPIPKKLPCFDNVSPKQQTTMSNKNLLHHASCRTNGMLGNPELCICARFCEAEDTNCVVTLTKRQHSLCRRLLKKNSSTSAMKSGTLQKTSQQSKKQQTAHCVF